MLNLGLLVILFSIRLAILISLQFEIFCFHVSHLFSDVLVLNAQVTFSLLRLRQERLAVLVEGDVVCKTLLDSLLAFFQVEEALSIVCDIG